MRRTRREGRQQGAAADQAILLSPLLNLAPARASGPRLNHVAPLMPLGGSRLSGTASLSLSPDRESVEVTAHLDGAAPVLTLRRLARRCLDGGADGGDGDLLVLLLSATRVENDRPGASVARSSVRRRLTLTHRHACLRLAWSADLARLGIDASELEASSIGGVRVEAAGGRAEAPTAPLSECLDEPMHLPALAVRNYLRTISSGAAACE
jgi:hypothetical protein